MSIDSFKDVINKICLQIIYIYKEDMALNMIQGLYALKVNQIKPNHIYLIYLYKQN